MRTVHASRTGLLAGAMATMLVGSSSPAAPRAAMGETTATATVAGPATATAPRPATATATAPKPATVRSGASGASGAASDAASRAANDEVVDGVELLRASDVSARAPTSFRARFRVTARGASREVEVWRDGADRSLARVLEPAEAGKSTLRIGAETWLITPRAKAPVKLGAALRLRGGAALDALTGVAYARDYDVAGVSEDPGSGPGVVVLDLRRRSGTAPGPPVRVRYVVDVVDAARPVPVRIESYLPGGRHAATLELSSWPKEGPGLPASSRLLDRLQGGQVTEVKLLELEVREVPAGLFDLRDASVRNALLGGGSP